MAEQSRETWIVELWIDNDAGSYNYVNGVVEEEGSVYLAARRLQEEYEEAAQDILDNAGQGASVWSDLLGHALRGVDWVEIARDHKPDAWGDADEAPEEEEEEE